MLCQKESSDITILDLPLTKGFVIDTYSFGMGLEFWYKLIDYWILSIQDLEYVKAKDHLVKDDLEVFTRQCFLRLPNIYKVAQPVIQKYGNIHLSHTYDMNASIQVKLQINTYAGWSYEAPKQITELYSMLTS